MHFFFVFKLGISVDQLEGLNEKNSVIVVMLKEKCEISMDAKKGVETTSNLASTRLTPFFPVICLYSPRIEKHTYSIRHF